MICGMRSSIEQVSASELVDANEAERGDRRRRWPAGLKRRIVAEALEPGSSVSVVARRHDVNANQLFKWIRQNEAAARGRKPVLVPVEVRGPSAALAGGGTIEIDLPGGVRVRISGAVEAPVLRQVLEQLR